LSESIDFDERFPKALCFYKPKNSISDNKLKSLEQSGRAVFTIKEDGMMYIVRKSEQFGVEIYSRRMELESEKFPHLVGQFEELPNGTILLGEMILEGYNNHMVAFKNVTRICRSDTEESLEKQKELGCVSYKVFDLAFYDYTNWLSSRGYEERYNKANELVKKLKYISVVSRLNMSHEDALEYTRRHKLEGLVVWDEEGIIGEGEAFTFNGKAYRPNVLWKSKVRYEDDFIVRFDLENEIGEFGKGKNNNKMKSVFLYQLENGKEVYLGKCGGGLTDEQREYYTTAEYPRVWRVKYDALQPGTGSLRYPVFDADRTMIGDKDVGECLLSEEIKAARDMES